MDGTLTDSLPNRLDLRSVEGVDVHALLSHCRHLAGFRAGEYCPRSERAESLSLSAPRIGVDLQLSYFPSILPHAPGVDFSHEEHQAYEHDQRPEEI